MTAIAARIGESAQKRLVLVACILGSSIVFVDGTVVNVALPAIQRDLGGGLTLQQWVVDAYLLTLGSLILLGGSLGDLFGERRVFSLGTALFGLTSIGCALAPSGAALIAARGLQGIAGALLTPAALAVITSTFSGEERGAAIGTWTAWTGISTVVGPLLGGWLVSAASWRSIFYLNVPLVAVTLATIAVALPRREGGKRVEVDVTGAVLCVLGLGGPVFALIEQPRRGWGDPLILATLSVGVVLLAAFVWWEQHASHPMLPLRLFRARNFTLANVETLFAYGALSILIFFLSLYLQQIAGYSPFRSGLALLPVTIVMFTLSRLVGRLSMRLGPRVFMGGGPILCAIGVAWMLPLGRSFDYWTELLPPLLVFALGLAALVAPLTSTVLAEAGEGDAGIASAVSNAVARVAGLLAIAVVGVAVAGPNEQLSLHGFRIATGITVALLAAAGLTGIAGIRNPR
ncbi:MAG TPA: DHA2 family efflux MFS transporter permease subunit [Gaiellaceae bacterium]|jgi:EmrB/QacA subfamily drug resistance transporter